MRLWPRRRWADPDHTGRDPQGRVYDGDTVRRDGQPRWADLLPPVNALAEPTRLLPTIRPLMTPGQEHRSRGGAW